MERLLDAIRNTKTLDGNFPIYQQAKIELVKIHPNFINPTANYVLVDNLKWLSNTWLTLLLNEYDIFNLNNRLCIDNLVISPPVIEWSECDKAPIVADGHHRLWLARQMKREVNCIYVSGVPSEYPFVSLPLNWNDVKLCVERPSTATRIIREGITDRKKYYRDLSFLGSLGPRHDNTS